MAGIHKLSAAHVTKARRKGYHGDGGGLFLYIGPSGAKSWVYRFSSPTARSPHNPKHGRPREMGLGPVHTVGLADARAKAVECRRLVSNGVDPIDARERQQAALRVEDARSKTFDQCAAGYIEAHRGGWRNPKHAAQWPSTLATYASPAFGSLPVQAVDVALVMKAVQPIWSTKTDTANRLRGRIEAVLGWAAAAGYRPKGDNPARWQGNLEHLLAPRGKVRKVKHHAALPYGEIGAFIAKVQGQEGVGALALEFTILTAARTSETLGAVPAEIDVAGAVWTVPPDRIKGGKEHRVPLCARALAIVKEAAALGGKFIFPGRKDGRPLSDMALLMLLERMGHDKITVHGFRSTFRDWAAECTNFPNEVVEMALAHVVGDKVEAAYRRGDLFEKRRKLMAAWAAYCAKPAAAGEVVPMRRKIA